MTPTRRVLPRLLAAGAALALPLALAAPTQAAGHGRDSDRDGMPDRWERVNDTHVHRADAGADPDHDGLRNIAELRHGLDPQDDDSDDDGVEDGTEVHDGTDDGADHDAGDDHGADDPGDDDGGHHGGSHT